MPVRLKLTTQALEEYVPAKKRTASGPAATSSAKRPKTREKIYNCTYEGCEKAFVRPCRLEEHLRSHTGERPYKCTADPENCDKSFLRASHLKAHVKALHLKDKHIRCTFMITPGKEADRGVFGFKRKASEPNTPRTDIDSDGDDEEAPRECGASFVTNQHLKRHMESHMKDFPHVCTEYPPCSAGFRKRGPLRRHIRTTHLNALPWGCPHKDIDDPKKDCTAAFDTKGKLGGHINTIHNRIAPARYTCAMCIMNTKSNGKGTEQTSEIPDTEKIAKGEGEKPSDDQQCINDELIDQNLNPNQDLGSGTSTPFPIVKSVFIPDPAIADPETASLQGRMGFKTYLELRKHTIQMHPPTCKHCDRTFKSSTNLKHHIKDSHGAELDARRKFPCDQCKMSFTKVYNLKVHIRSVHENLRPFKCTYSPCTKAYNYKADLQIHIENKHSGREPKQRKPRGRSTKKPGLIEQLTGVGYENSGRNIECVVDGCSYRFCRMYDLKVHLKGRKGHGFDEDQVEELMIEAEMARDGGEDETEDSEMEWDGSSGSGSDEDDQYGVGLGYADLWDSMSDMDLDKETE